MENKETRDPGRTAATLVAITAVAITAVAAMLAIVVYVPGHHLLWVAFTQSLISLALLVMAITVHGVNRSARLAALVVSSSVAWTLAEVSLTASDINTVVLWLVDISQSACLGMAMTRLLIRAPGPSRRSTMPSGWGSLLAAVSSVALAASIVVAVVAPGSLIPDHWAWSVSAAVLAALVTRKWQLEHS